MSEAVETEIIDKLFLELSQITRANTAKELAIYAKLQELREAVEPFAEIVYDSDGRVPTERLSFANWRKLAAIYRRQSTEQLKHE